ncbi:hypothetical protein [Gordonia spumicola]|uniref:hypothetical protein n=1 Tax=Gordonia spumicola TaxID=589161 RepID=UPI001E5DF74D|nr:hypothetical protein [Gordonia spumicola]
MAVVADQVVDVESDSRGGRRSVGLVWALAAVAAVVLTLLGVKGADLYQSRQDSARDAEVLDVTKDVVAGLVSLDYKRSKADLDRISSVATGAFQQQFGQLSASFAQVLASGEVRSTGAVKEAGIVRADDDSAQVLAAVSSVVKNTEAPDGQQRVYRMLVDLEKHGDDWKVGNVEFVS